MPHKDFTHQPLLCVEVLTDEPTVCRAAASLASELGLKLLSDLSHVDCRFILGVDGSGLSLKDLTQPNVKPLVFSSLKTRPRHRGIDLLARAIGSKNHSIIDATAGFGHDSFHMLSLGKHVVSIERSPIVAAMLADSARRLISSRFATSMQLVCADSKKWLTQNLSSEVIYLDPMFPDRESRSALARKEDRMLRALVGNDSDAISLFSIARAVALRRVVVKRPAWAEPLEANPSMSYQGRTVRYDVYVTRT